MVNRKISVDLKECSLRLWELGWDKEFIAETSVATALAGVFAISVNKICKIMEIFE